MIESKELLPAPQDVGQALAYAQELSKSELLPAIYKGKPQNILIAMMWSKSIGMPTIQGLNSIAVINGRPSLYGDALKALVMSSGQCEDFEESFDEKAYTATCRIKRRGIPSPTVATFSYEEAGTAGLTGKTGPWKQYPKRMCQMRARAFAIRDAFPDLLMGIAVAEEQQDAMGVEDASYEHPEPVAEKNMPRRKKKEVSPEVVDVAEQPAPAAEKADVQAVDEAPAKSDVEQAPETVEAIPEMDEASETVEAIPEMDEPPFEGAQSVSEFMAKIDAANSYEEVVAIWKTTPADIRPVILEACAKRRDQLQATSKRNP